MPKVVSSELMTLEASIQSLNPFAVCTVMVQGFPLGCIHCPFTSLNPAPSSRPSAVGGLLLLVLRLDICPELRLSCTPESIIPVVYLEGLPLTGSATFWTA